MDSDFIQEIIDSTKAQIRALNTTILALSGKSQSEYMEDTSQGRIRVTRQNLPDLIEARENLLAELDMWTSRLNGTGSLTLRPGW